MSNSNSNSDIAIVRKTVLMREVEGVWRWRSGSLSTKQAVLGDRLVLVRICMYLIRALPMIERL